MDYRKFAEQWIASTYQSDFRLGMLTYDTPEAHELAIKSLPPRQRRSTERLNPRFSQFTNELLKKLAGSEITVEQARSEVEAADLSRYVKVVNTKEELIRGIARIMEDGANAWSDGGKNAWREGGLFVCVFWRDSSHPRGKT
jgi:hypothetical protein